MNEGFLQLFLVLVVMWPLFLAGAMVTRTMHSTVLRIVPFAALPALLLAVFTSEDISLQLSWVLLGAELRLEDGSSRLFLLFTSLLWLLSGIYARSYLPNQPSSKRFSFYFLLTMTGNLGLILAQDLMSFYLFFALMSFVSYGLVVHERSAEALRAGQVYIILVVIGEIALFSAMILTATSTGSTEFDIVRQKIGQADFRNLIMFLAFIGFGIKAGVLGLHMWLPLAHPVAPTPASAVLSGAMIKAGLLGWLRLLPIGEIAMVQWGQIFISLGIASVFYGVLIGLTQRVPKTVLAYSSISQMGIMIMALGLGLTAPGASPEILTAITLFALHHGLCKGALFLGVGVIGACNGIQRRWVWIVMLLPALALAGAPLTSGMVVKILLKVETISAPAPWDFVLQTLLPLSSIATTLLLGRFLVLLFKPYGELSVRQSTAGLVWPWGLLVAASVVVPWISVPESSKLWTQATFLGSLWPVSVGVMMILAILLWEAHQSRQSGAMSKSGRRMSVDYFSQSIPPGDLLVLINHLLSLIFNLSYRLTSEILPQWRDHLLTTLRQLWSQVGFWQTIGWSESKLRCWPVPLIILVILGLIMASLGMIA